MEFFKGLYWALAMSIPIWGLIVGAVWLGLK